MKYDDESYAYMLRLLAQYEAHHYGKGLAPLAIYSETFPTVLRRMAQRLALGYAPDNPAKGYTIGQFTSEDLPTTLILGEKASGARLLNWPFLSLKETGCSAWLTALLEEECVWEEDLCWINLYSTGGGLRRDLPREIFSAPWAAVVALGKNAHKGAEELGLKVTNQVHHPAYWMRYQKKPYILPRLLRAIRRVSLGVEVQSRKGSSRS